MSNLIRIEIPSHVDEDDWREFLESQFVEFKDALDLSAGVDPNDHRVTFHGVDIKELELFEDEVHLHYLLIWSAYYGCEDQNATGDEPGCVSAQRQGNVLIFERHVYPEGRSTLDEY